MIRGHYVRACSWPSIRTNRYLRCAGALIAGGTLPLAYAPYGYWWLAPLALAVLLLLWEDNKPGEAFKHGWLFGFGWFSVGLFWIRVSIDLYGNLGTAWSIAATLLMAGILACLPAGIGYLSRRLRWRQATATWRLLGLMPALWTLAEHIRARLGGGFPWLNVGYSQTDSPLSGLLPVIGVPGVGYVVMVSAGLIALWWLRRSTMPATVCIPAVLLSLWLSAQLLTGLSWTTAQPGVIRATIVQAAIEQELKWRPEYLEKTTRLYQELSEPHWQNSDLIVWPEAAIPAFYHQMEPWLAQLRQQAAAHDTDLVTGMPVYDKDSGHLYNSLLYLAEPDQIYHKRHLVPFGEYLPWSALARPVFDALHIPYSDFSAAPEGQIPVLHLKSGKAGALICYEVLFGHEVTEALPAAGFFLNVSNDAWFGDTNGPHQHLQITRARAIEVERPFIRATNNGISAVIDADGRVLARSGQFQPEVISTSIQARTGLTPYARFTDYPMLLLMLALAALTWHRSRPAG